MHSVSRINFESLFQAVVSKQQENRKDAPNPYEGKTINVSPEPEGRWISKRHSRLNDWPLVGNKSKADTAHSLEDENQNVDSNLKQNPASESQRAKWTFGKQTWDDQWGLRFVFWSINSGLLFTERAVAVPFNSTNVCGVYLHGNSKQTNTEERVTWQKTNITWRPRQG